MVKRTYTNNEYHRNGLLSYTETIAELEKGHSFDNTRIAQNGTEWMRIGLNAKYREDGTQQWRIDHYTPTMGQQQLF